MNLLIWVWLGAVVVFGVAEALTAGLVSIWFVAGALSALLAAVAGANLAVQLVLFVVVSALALILTRPLVKRFTAARPVATNLDRVIGQTGQVTETVDNASATGAVYVDGKTWSARSIDGAVLPAGTAVHILKMEGVKLFVEKNKVLEEVK